MPPTREIDLFCHRCGYNLRTLDAGGRCPECNTPVAEARAVAERLAEIGHPRRVRLAAGLLAAAPLIPALPALSLALFLTDLLPTSRTSGVLYQVLMAGCFVFAAAVVIASSWLLVVAGLSRRRLRLAWPSANFALLAAAGVALSLGMASEIGPYMFSAYHDLLMLRRALLVVLCLPAAHLVGALLPIATHLAGRLQRPRVGKAVRLLFPVLRVYLLLAASTLVVMGLAEAGQPPISGIALFFAFAAGGALLALAWSVCWLSLARAFPR